MHGISSNNWTKKKQLYLCEERRYFNFDMMKTHYSEKENFEFFRKKEVFFFFFCMGPSQHGQNLVLRKINGKLNIGFGIFAKKVEICDNLKKK